MVQNEPIEPPFEGTVYIQKTHDPFHYFIIISLFYLLILIDY